MKPNKLDLACFPKSWGIGQIDQHLLCSLFWGHVARTTSWAREKEEFGKAIKKIVIWSYFWGSHVSHKNFGRLFLFYRSSFVILFIFIFLPLSAIEKLLKRDKYIYTNKGYNLSSLIRLRQLGHVTNKKHVKLVQRQTNEEKKCLHQSWWCFCTWTDVSKCRPKKLWKHWLVFE